MDALKKAAAEAALQYIETDAVVGVGTGSTVHFFINALASMKNRIEGAVASSIGTCEQLKAVGIQVLDFNSVDRIPVYIDGADAVNHHLQLIKGGGGALTREKILATASKRFVCIADSSKLVDVLSTDHTPLPIEVIPMARSYVARELVKLGGSPIYRQGFVTDNGNVILDVFNLSLDAPLKLESQLNNIPGVVSNGLFAARPADILLLGSNDGVKTMQAI